jgi:hypothetical protein
MYEPVVIPGQLFFFSTCEDSEPWEVGVGGRGLLTSLM